MLAYSEVFKFKSETKMQDARCKIQGTRFK
jgi:hypothetical protein